MGFSPAEENPRQRTADRTTTALPEICRPSANTNSLRGQCRPRTVPTNDQKPSPKTPAANPFSTRKLRTFQNRSNAHGRGHSYFPNIFTAAGKRLGGSNTRDRARSRTLRGDGPPPRQILARPRCGNCTGRAGQPGLHSHAQFNRLDSQPSNQNSRDPSSARG